jgi:membrane associated rhomboid family serine protease
MNPFWKIFLSIFCYMAAICGLGLAVINASHTPSSTRSAFIFGVSGAVFGILGIVLNRKPRY